RQAFDLVIVDAPELHAPGGAALLRQCDATLIVARGGSPAAEVAARLALPRAGLVLWR
ncbi:MAG: hypothetical protein JO261_02575, partial [Alphaproteobacteria bacterium]|nr:hypothetical protein [Alphaproteobacteria bacterium]